ncbi:MAG: BrnA antitoxin family protein [Candidatus Omnitrophica bacterium]|nr:BrnA antitoxin family protein [Candidatus Omnitrophota bacterium]
MRKKLPKFKSEEEEARFWATHSPLDYPDEFTDVEEPLEISPSLLKKVKERREERKRLLTLRIGQHQIDLAKVIARCRGIGYQTQMRMWVIEGMRKDIAAHPEIRKLITAK